MAARPDTVRQPAVQAADNARDLLRWLADAILVGVGIVMVLSAAVLLLTQLAQAAPARPAPATSDPAVTSVPGT